MKSRQTFQQQQGVASAAAAVQHPHVSQHIAPTEMSDDDKQAWIRSVAPEATDAEVQQAAKAFMHYSGGGYGDIHDGSSSSEADYIDRVLTAPNTPVYDGTIYRGLEFRSEHGKSAESRVKQILSGGVWTEPGITSFTTKRKVALEFSDHIGGPNSVGVVVKCLKNRTGVPFQHLSGFGASEAEVLTPSSVKNHGWNIVSHRWKTDLNGHKTCYITVEENP